MQEARERNARAFLWARGAVVGADSSLQPTPDVLRWTPPPAASRMSIARQRRHLSVVLVFIHQADAQLNMARVAQRVSEGGHAVPDEKVAGRLPRTQALIKQALPLCDEVWLLDDASAEQPFKQVARLRYGRLIASLPGLPD